MASLLFDADVTTHGLAKYEDIVHEKRITVVPDPILGAGRRVLRFDVHDTDTGPTVNPRAQACSPRVVRDGMDLWFGWCTLFPPGFPEKLPAGKWPFLTLTEVYGPPYGGSSPVRVGMRPETPGLSVMGGDQVLVDLGPLKFDVWHDFAMHERISADPAEGFVELLVNTGGGWATALRQHVATLTAANGNGPNYHKLSSYRMAGMYDRLTMYHGEHRVGYSFSEVAPASHTSSGSSVK